MCNRSTLSNTHYLPSGYLSHDCNTTPIPASQWANGKCAWPWPTPIPVCTCQQSSGEPAHLFSLFFCLTDGLNPSSLTRCHCHLPVCQPPFLPPPPPLPSPQAPGPTTRCKQMHPIEQEAHPEAKSAPK